jgi:single-strand DNA-binding protein
MASFNNVVLMGNLCRDPEMRYTQGGTAIASISLAVNRKWKDQAGELKEEVSFIDCTAFGRTAEVAGQYVRKGQPLLVHGRLQQQTWEDKNGGGKRSKVVVIIESLVLLASKGDGQAASQAPSQPAKASAPASTAPVHEPAEPVEDVVPF